MTIAKLKGGIRGYKGVGGSPVVPLPYVLCTISITFNFSYCFCLRSGDMIFDSHNVFYMAKVSW